MKDPKPITPSYLRWHLDNYLKRYMTSRAHLRELMMRRVRRSHNFHGGELEPLVELLDKLLDELVERGALNDEAFAKSKVRSMVRRGASAVKIRSKLAGLRVGQHANEGFAEVREERGVDPSLLAACAFVRQRRIGCYRGELQAANFDKDIGKLARAGFPWAICKQVLAAQTVEELEELTLPM